MVANDCIGRCLRRDEEGIRGLGARPSWWRDIEPSADPRDAPTRNVLSEQTIGCPRARASTTLRVRLTRKYWMRLEEIFGGHDWLLFTVTRTDGA